MSTYNSQYQYQWPPGQLQFPTNFLGYGQDDARRSKSPSSLVNHPGYSPGPLSTPPMSRNPSQPPEDPEQMVLDDSIDSQSDSPTSVRTPDRDSLDGMEMFDISGGINSQVYQDTNSLEESYRYFPDPMLHQTLQDTIASQALQSTQYSAPFNPQGQQLQPSFAPQPYDRTENQGYPGQAFVQDPWSSQRPSQNPSVPRSGMAVFDPTSDSVYPTYINGNVSRFMNNVNMNYVPSSSQAMSQRSDNFFYNTPTPQTYQHRPMDIRLMVPQAAAPAQPFINYNSNNLDFNDGNLVSPSSPGSSTMGSSVGQIPSPYQENRNFQPSVPSPGASESTMSSFQYPPDAEMQYNSFDVRPELFDAKPTISVSPVQFNYSPAPMALESSSDTSPEPEARARAQSIVRGGGRPGGRALGTHLEPKVAKAAHDMRKTVACWHCVLQRDKCGPGDICERCMKRSQRPNADCGLGCSRIKLIELAQYFIPTIVTQMHEDAHLTHFVSQHIRSWGNIEITLMMTCGQSSMPRIPVKVYEFSPLDNELLVQIQYKTDPVTHKRLQLKKQSPALGMVHINKNEEKVYDKYISDIVDHHILAFANLCWLEDDNNFQAKLFKLMVKLQPKNDEEEKIRREVFRLLVATFIVSHVLNIAEETKHASLKKMHSYQPNSYVQNFTSPRMTNRQLKYFFSRIQRSIMNNVLNKLQQIFKSSKGCDKWLGAFIAVVGMCMAHEEMQKTIHLVQLTKAATENRDSRQLQDYADIANRDIDSRMHFINQIFRWKYNRKYNPLRDADHDWNKEVGFGDENSVTFVRQVAQLVKENIDFLTERQSVSISHANQVNYSSRLVGKFLLSFWLPQVS